MRPDEVSTTPASMPSSLGRPIESSSNQAGSQQAAAELLRNQINNLYETPAASVSAEPSASPSQLDDVNPYDRTHASHPQPQQDQWKQYHSAWQTYYQKYYEGYYAHHLQKAKQSLQASTNPSTSGYFSQQPDEPEIETMSRDETLFDLRQKLLTKVQGSAKKVRKSRHFMPIAAALVVVLLFSFLQYNRVLVASVVAYVSPGNIDPQNIVVDPTTDIAVTPEPRLIIPKINVDVPVLYDVGNDPTSQLKAMESGVAHFAIPGASSHPGQIGNTVISGHSSNDILDSGDYKFIFAQLEKLVVGDSIYANYNGKRYTYTITKREVVRPTEVNKLVYPTTKPVLTLITCTPLGTAIDRLLVTAEQVSPDPTASAAAPAVTSTETASIPGNSPTFFERLFGN